MEYLRWVRGKGFDRAEGRPQVTAEESSARGVRLLLPPLWDHHGHVAALGALLEQADLRGCPSEEAALVIARDTASRLPVTSWLEGFGWDQNLWGGRYPDRASLDALFPDRPVLLRRVDGHAAWVNSAALALGGFGEGTPDPPGGSFLRDRVGLTGILLDTAMEAVAALVPQPSGEALRRRILAGLRRLESCGLSGVTDMGLEPPQVEALCELDSENLLPIPVEGFAWVKPGEAGGRAPRRGTKFHLAGIKLFADGALGSRGAALREDYQDARGARGFMLWGDGDLERVLREARRAGLVPAIHAIGDRAAEQVISAVEACGVEGVRLEHAQVLSGEDVTRMAAAGMVAGIQPCHYLSDRSWAPERLGERMALAYRWGSLARAGIELRMGTDFPIEDPAPARNFSACALREDPSERLEMDQVLTAYAPPRWARHFCGETLARGESLGAWAAEPGSFRFTTLASGVARC